MMVDGMSNEIRCSRQIKIDQITYALFITVSLLFGDRSEFPTAGAGPAFSAAEVGLGEEARF